MISFIVTLIITIIIFITGIILTIIACNRNKKRNGKTTSIKNRNKDIIIAIASAFFATLSFIAMLYTLFNSIPTPTIYPLDNDAKVYSGTAKVDISAYPLLTTYYSLDGSAPENGNIYEGTFTITKTTTVSAKNRFLIFWSDLSQNTFRFEDAQNITVNRVDNNTDEHISVQDIFTYALVFLIFCAIFVPVIRGDK